MIRKIISCICLCVFFAGNSYALKCNECHSKNPKMVKMHQALGFKDCFKCHGFKGKKSKEELKEQMVTDEKCVGCHHKKL